MIEYLRAKRRNIEVSESNTETVEDGIARLVQERPSVILDNDLQPVAFAPPNNRLPDYVTHLEGVDVIGALSAEALVKSHEMVSHDLAKLGLELIEGTKAVIQLASDAQHMIEEIRTSIAGYREQAKDMFNTVEQRAKLNADVREQLGKMIEHLRAQRTP